MAKRPTSPPRLVCQNLYTVVILFSIIFSLFWATPISAQSKEQLIGHWQLQQVSFRKMNVKNDDNDKKRLFGIFKAALYDQLTNEQQANLDDHEWTKSKAETLTDNFYKTTMEFKANGAFYYTTKVPDKSLSGEFLLDKKKLLLEWETGEKNIFKVLKKSVKELVLKNTKLKTTYYYLNI
ncbi:hypothetical protein ACS386_11490 [Flavobacteriaceae bacterium LMO-SS05]